MNLLEVGRVLSKASETKIRQALDQLKTLLTSALGEDTAAAVTAKEAITVLDEALSFNDRETMLRAALRANYPGKDNYVWVRDTWDDSVVYEVESVSGGNLEILQASYSIVDNKVTLGDPKKVMRQTVYVPISETTVQAAAAIELTGDVIPLVERAVNADSTVKLKVIQPGWGSSGYYPAEVLKRDGPIAFAAGTKMYWNHPTVSESSERPERDLRDLAAELVGPASWIDNGSNGAGLYADAKVFGPYKDHVEELAPHIGVSIRAAGTAKDGEAEGRKGKIVESIVAGKSIDFVTQAGAGGQILSLFESARGSVAAKREDVNVAELAEIQKKLDELTTQLAESKADNARMGEALILRDSQTFVLGHLNAAHGKVPALTRVRIAESLSGNPPLKDGAIDKEAFKAAIDEAVKAEMAYISGVAGSQIVTGMGTSQPTTEDTSKVQERLQKAFSRLGLDESTAKAAAAN